MNQPDLGLKVTELRQLKGLTQEQLAEACEVSTRTIQRIESGEVDPRSYTLQCLSSSLDFDFMQDQTLNENLWLVILHLSSVFCIVFIPLLLWSWKKNQSYKIDKQGRQVLNFQITMTLFLVANILLLMIVPVAITFMGDAGNNIFDSRPLFMLLAMCATSPLFFVGVFCIWQGVRNTMRAMADEPIRYPLSIPFMT